MSKLLTTKKIREQQQHQKFQAIQIFLDPQTENDCAVVSKHIEAKGIPSFVDEKLLKQWLEKGVTISEGAIGEWRAAQPKEEFKSEPIV